MSQFSMRVCGTSYNVVEIPFSLLIVVKPQYSCEGVGFDGLSLISSASLFGLPSVDSTPCTSLLWDSETSWPVEGEFPMRLVSPDGAKVYKDPVKISSEDATKRTSAVQQEIQCRVL